MGYIIGTYGKYIGAPKDHPIFNFGAVFATAEQANRAGNELLVYHAAPEGFVIAEVASATTVQPDYGHFLEVDVQRGQAPVAAKGAVAPWALTAKERDRQARLAVLHMVRHNPKLRKAVKAALAKKKVAP